MILVSLQRLLLFFMCLTNVSGQDARLTQTGEEEAVKKTIGLLFDGMRKGDSSMVKAAFAPDATLQTIASPPGGGVKVKTQALQRFLDAVGTPHTDVWDEQIVYGQISVDGPLASVWTPYKFYLGGKFSHCGVNSFQLVKLEGEWKIVYLIDTRRKECE
jgi:hypothetical protein